MLFRRVSRGFLRFPMAKTFQTTPWIAELRNTPDGLGEFRPNKQERFCGLQKLPEAVHIRLEGLQESVNMVAVGGGVVAGQG